MAGPAPTPQSSQNSDKTVLPPASPRNRASEGDMLHVMVRLHVYQSRHAEPERRCARPLHNGTALGLSGLSFTRNLEFRTRRLNAPTHAQGRVEFDTKLPLQCTSAERETWCDGRASVVGRQGDRATLVPLTQCSLESQIRQLVQDEKIFRGSSNSRRPFTCKHQPRTYCPLRLRGIHYYCVASGWMRHCRDWAPWRRVRWLACRQWRKSNLLPPALGQRHRPSSNWPTPPISSQP
jgi:hypothetical protein